MATINKFSINVSQEVIDDLIVRINNTRWTQEPEGAGWGYGTNSAYLKQLVQHWSYDYDWRKHEAYLNQFDQFTTDIDGITIHFLHIKGKGAQRKPLLLVHGWPDSFYRF